MTEKDTQSEEDNLSAENQWEISRPLWSRPQKKNLYSALVKAQGELEGAKKAAKNDHFRSKYARLEDVIDAIRTVFAKHGLGYVQHCGYDSGCARVETVLVHESGEDLSSELSLPVTKQDAQGIGSALTYARRYALMGIAGIAPEDDDGEAAVGRGASGKTQENAAGWKYISEAAATVGDLEVAKSLYSLAKEYKGAVSDEKLMSVLKPLGEKITGMKGKVVSK